MAEVTKRKYIKGSSRTKIFENGGSNTYLSLLKADLDKLVVNEDGYVKLVISEKKEVDKFGNSHDVYENEWKPDPNFRGKKGVTPPGGDATKRATPVDLKTSQEWPF